MPDMPRRRPPFIRREKTRHGRVAWYFRKDDGPRVRLPEPYGSDAFWGAYRAALDGKAPKAKPGKGSIAWLVDQYKRSGSFARLAPSTRRNRDRIMRQIVEKVGDKAVSTIDRKKIQAMMDAKAGEPHGANNWLKTIRALLQHAVAMQEIAENPAALVKLNTTAGDGFEVWTADDLEAFEARHPVGTKARLAFDLMLYTGLRKSDVVQVGRQHIRDGVMTIRPEKTKRSTNVTVTQQLPAELLASIDATPTGDLFLLVTQFGEPFTANGFGNWFRRRCDEAGVSKSAHGLRKAGAVRAAEQGATAHDLLALFGWVSLKEAQIYTAAADRRRIGLEASSKLASRRTTSTGAALNAKK